MIYSVLEVTAMLMDVMKIQILAKMLISYLNVFWSAYFSQDLHEVSNYTSTSFILMFRVLIYWRMFLMLTSVNYKLA